MREILVEVRLEYGNYRIYPVCEEAHRLLSLTGKLTFSPFHIREIRKLGYHIKTQAGVVKYE